CVSPSYPSVYSHDPPSRVVSFLSLHDALPISMEAIDDAAVFETADNGAVFARTVGHLFRFYQGTTMNYSGCYLGAMLSMGAKAIDRKSTRLNSSHVSISYAVFCLKKKRTSTTI